MINNLGFNAHTLPYFHNCNILKLTDLYSVELSAFMFSLTVRGLPNPSIEIFQFNNQVHAFNTIQTDMPHVVRHRTQQVNKSILHIAQQEYNSIPAHIKVANTLKEFRNKLKKHLILKYASRS